MQFEIYQWLVPIIGAFFIFRTVKGFLKGRRSAGSTVIWLVFWATILLLAIVPNEISYKLAGILGFKSNVNAVIFVGLAMLFLFVFYLSSSIEKLENQLTELSRKIAIDRPDLIKHTNGKSIPKKNMIKTEAVKGEKEKNLDQ